MKKSNCQTENLESGTEYLNDPKCGLGVSSCPPYYVGSKGLEAFDVISQFTNHLIGAEAICTGNAIKYILRWKRKNGVQDLKKARHYINMLIEIEENQEKKLKEEKAYCCNDISTVKEFGGKDFAYFITQ